MSEAKGQLSRWKFMVILVSVITVIYCVTLQRYETLRPPLPLPQVHSALRKYDEGTCRYSNLTLEKSLYTAPGCACNRSGYDLEALRLRRQEALEHPEDFPEWFLEKYAFDGDSTCSDFSTQRGRGQRVLSYVYYTKSGRTVLGSTAYKKYLSQVYNTVAKIGRVYPGWVVRIHHNVTEEDAVGMAELCRVYCDHHFVDLCHVHSLPGLGNMRSRGLTGMMWRFAVMGDPTVEIFMSRDTDSWVLDREVAAVKEWLESNRTFHVVHDHPNHGPVILGGFWGGRNRNPVAMRELRDLMYEMPKSERYGHDQQILKNVVWPVAKHDVLNHASFTCMKHLKTHGPSVPFPTQREGSTYCGWGTYKVIEASKVAKEVCPLECRPKDHQDWTKC